MMKLWFVYLQYYHVIPEGSGFGDIFEEGRRFLPQFLQMLLQAVLELLFQCWLLLHAFFQYWQSTSISFCCEIGNRVEILFYFLNKSKCLFVCLCLACLTSVSVSFPNSFHLNSRIVFQTVENPTFFLYGINDRPCPCSSPHPFCLFSDSQ